MPESKIENRVLESMFLRDKPAKILLGLKTSKDSVYATILSKEANCTYSHTIKILNMFRDMGIVGFEKTGRIKRVRLTDDGWDMANKMEAMIKKFVLIEEACLKEKAREKAKTRKETKPAKKVRIKSARE